MNKETLNSEYGYTTLNPEHSCIIYGEPGSKPENKALKITLRFLMHIAIITVLFLVWRWI